ncbi:hypothetical protein [Sporisorium scitamineum]|uniref:Uncharacterized protein n=1 Tax=Sporisorium scitamineum TaxID=49012 RepID=A0A0F7S8U3_9BASI|nr:hypothetical protein [Sporisorium scitamineum]
MPFDPRTKSRKTTTLPVALRVELGLSAPSTHRRPFRPQDRGNRFNANNSSGKPQLKAIGRPQSAMNGAAKGTPRGPIKPASQHKQPKQRHDSTPHASSSRQLHRPEEKVQQKRKSEKQPEAALKVIKKPKSSQQRYDDSEPAEQKTRLNPFTGEMEVVKSAPKLSSSSKPTALEKMLARAEAGPSSSKGKAKASDALAGKKKSRRHMTQQEKEEEDEIRWLEYSLGKSRAGRYV